MTTGPACPDCGLPMEFGGVALACGPHNKSVRVELPPWCSSVRCRSDRDAAAIAKAVATGVIDP